MTVAEQTAPKLTAYELQVLIGTTISGCNMSPDRTFDLPAAWARLKGLGLIDRADGIANATPAGVELVASLLTELQHRIEEEAGETILWRGGRGGLWPDALGAAADALAEFEGGIDVHSDVDARAALVIRAYIDAQPAIAASPSSPASGVRVKAGDPSMWATVVEDDYDGSLRWDCHTEGDRGDGDSLATISLAADTFPAGTTLEIRELRSALGEHP